MTHDARVESAIAHWAPRFVSNGVLLQDFQEVTAGLDRWDDWCRAWSVRAAVHEALGHEALGKGHRLTGGEHFTRAGVYYHFAKFIFVHDVPQMRETHGKAVGCRMAALPHVQPPGERVEIPYHGSRLAGILRRPAGPARPPVVILIPGLDSAKEEFDAYESTFLARGMATLSVDGPGQSENAPRFPIRPEWATVIGAIFDGLRERKDVDRDRVGLMGISMGGIYGPRAAVHEKRLKAVIALAGPYDLSECWSALNPLTRGGYVFYTKSRDEAEAFEKAKTLTLRGVLDKVTCPLLVVHGAKDRLFPPEQAERIAREAPKATLLMYPDGNHVCNNIPYKYRPAMADWMRERLTT